MKTESLYIQKLTYDENTGNEIIGLFPSEAHPAIVSSYTYDAKRMGGAPTITATIYSSEPLQWKKEEFVEYNGDRFFASYTPNSTKDNSSIIWKSEITFTSRRELLDNTLFFDVVVDDVDTQNKDRYRSNQTKFTFGGTIYEFIARINSSMAYCGLYRPTDEYKGYYVVVDEGYGTDEVKEVSFEDQYLTDVLQLINTTFELDYYWDGNVCHVGKVQHDLTDTPIKYGSSDALISVSKENANYKIVDMITGYGSSDNLPYYYPNDDEFFGEAVFNTENISKDKVSVELSKFLKDSIYNDTIVLYKSKEGKSYNGSVDVSPPAFYIHSSTIPENLSQADSPSNPTVTCSFWINIPISAIKGQKIDLTNLNFSFELFSYITRPDFISNVGKANRSIKLRKIGEETYVPISEGMSFGNVSTYTFEENGDFTLTIGADFSYNCKVFNSDGIRSFYGASVWNVAFGGSVEFSYESKSEYEWKNGDKYIPYSEAGINVSGIGEANCIEYDYQFVKDGDRYGFNKVYTGTEDNAVKVIVTDRVWIAPSSVLMPSIYRNTKGTERFYYALNNTHKLPSGSGYYEFVNLYKKGNPHQGTVTFDDIKPTINGIVNAEGQLFGEIADVAFDKEDSDVKDSDGTTYIHQYFYIKLHKFSGEFGFDLFNHVLAKESAKINLIKSNGCPACSFVIYNQPSADNSKCYNCVSVDENGNLKRVRTDKNDYIFANASDAYEDKLNQDSTQKELWIAVQKDTSTLGIVMPNASAGFKPQKGDLFVITGIKPPKVLVTAAEKRLDDALIKHMSENNTDQFNYSVKFSRIFLQENPDFASKLNENAKLSIQIQGDSDSDGNLISHEVFVSNYSVKVDNDELAEVEIELVNSLEVTKSDVKQIIDAVKGEAVKSLSSMVGGSSTNNFNASIADKMYLSKLKDDIASGTITFQKVQKFLQGLLVGGGSWTPDAEGRSHLITDYLEVRMKAIFEELVINKTSTIGGKEIISPAGGVVAHKVEEVTVTYNNVSQKAYRCYFLAEQEGDAVDNDFAVNDQVRSESFNVRKGTYHKAGNHFYWRLVIGRDEDPVELEGKKYHYIDLSDTDCATASDVPAKGDVLNQCGNKTDVERQNCLIFSAVDTYSPSISLYHGINSYSFANREYVDYGVNHSTNKAFFHVYGDMYFGDRPTSANNYEGDSYVKYDSDKKKVTIKGDLDIKSTYDGKTLDKYITEKSLDKNAVETIIKKSDTITDLQNQIDGAIETWFYDGVPTLKTEPASGWDTDMMKNHLGDLYYDNKTGKAYRFAKDGSTYKWIIITDTELTKAIEDSSQALKDAKSKRRIFGSQPVPPYDVNDMWVNATYPSDGSTYKNEILKCSTSKAEGEEFDIADWKLASKYTDDTKAEEAKKAAEKAQAEIKNTQTNLITLGTTVSNNKKAFDVFTSDGYLDSSEIAAIAQDSKRLEDDYNAAVESYNNVVGSKFLLDKDGKETTYKTDLVSAKATLDSAKNELITYLSDIVSRYNASDSNGKATIKAAAAQKYTNFTNAYKAFYDKLGVANNYITSNLFDGLNTKLITNMAGLEYIKAALVDGDTVVKGGLILSTLIALRNDKGNVSAGINGADTKENGIALWLGGKAIDKQASTTTEEEKKIAAKSLLRFDGTGYFANGNLWWDADGILHADPTSFIINKNNVGVQLALFAPVWKSGTTDTTKLANVLSIDPQKPFTHLDVSGNVTTEGSLKIGGIYLSYDSANNALRLSKDAAGKEAANFYTTGGITAYGAGASTTGGGGLIASVISYARILEGSYTDADLTSIPNAYAIKALSSRIDNIATELGGLNLSWNNITGKPSTFAPSAHTHKWTEITDRITKVSQLTNDAGYLTAHQSLASYYTKAEIDAKGYTTNKGTVTSVALTLPTGLACATKTITTSGTFAVTFASGYSIPTTTKQTAWDGAVSAKHTHSNKSVLDGISSAKVTHWDSAYDWYALMTTDEETADGIINKWNEVVSFLANIAQTDTLSGIVDGINKSISDEVTRAKKAEGVNASGISTNKTNITTLQGYFTNGSAKKALQLTNARKFWGNSFNGTSDINGSIIVPNGKYISIGNIKMEYDATNKALKITNTTTNEVANLYTSGGVSAYGVGTSSSSGGGLNGSVKSYSSALKLTSESLSEIASAYSIKALSSRIDNIATELGGLNLSWNNITGKPSTFAPSAHTHKWTEITDRITKVSQLTNDAGYLTAHQSLASYYTKAEIDAKGYTTNKGTVTSVALTLPTGLACATKTITTSGTFAVTFASGYSIPTTTKQTAWDGAVSAKHTHSNKSVLDGISSAKVTHWDSAYDWYALMTTDEETADGIINKWNEVVSFLANIAQTDTLSGIVDGINKSISDEVTRAKKAEGVNASGISTNKTNITTLQGYFTNGSAKKALQLTNARKFWGNSFNGTSDINGSIIVPNGKYISIGNIKMEYDATNKALKITNTTTNEVANLYTSGGVSAYGVGTSSSSGGGLNGSVKSYSSALKLTSESLSEIASAYSIKALDSRISSLEGGSATAISVSGSGNAVTSVTKNGTTISVVKGSTFLTSHQSLDDYVNAISVSGSGNAITSVSKSGKGITFTKGATFLTSHQSLANYYTKSSVDSLLSGKSATSHTHSVKINGVTKTIAATGGTAVDLGTYLTSHQSLADYAKKSEIPTKVSQLTNDTGYITSSGSCAYATSAGNADKVDGVHVTWAGVLTSTSHLVAWESDGSALRDINPANVTVGNSDKLDGVHANGLLTALSNSDKGISITVGGTTKSISNISVNYASSAGNADTVDGYQVNGSNVAPYGHIPSIENDGVMEVGKYIDFHDDNSGKHDFSTRLQTTGNYGNPVNLPSASGTLALTTDNVASAAKLQTPRTIWGQSFDGTGNVNGTIYINNNNSGDGAIRLNNDINVNARISAIGDQVIFNTGNAIRFGETTWDWNKWAGLKYNHSNKTIYLGIANGSIFNANSPQSDGTLRLAGIKTVTPDSGARIGGSGSLYIGNANNSGWVYVQNMCSQVNSSYWNITQNGSAIFKSLTVNDVISCNSISVSKNAVIAGNLSVNGLINNKGILPTNYEVNNKGTSCYVSADELCSGITAITDSIPVDNLSIVYSNDNGTNWTNYNISNDTKFKAYANVAGVDGLYLGGNVITGNNDAEKLAQIKKNQLMFTFDVPNNCYSQVYFASVDIGQGVGVTCTVEYLNSKGVIVNTFIKYMNGWNQFNYINLSNGNVGLPVGNDSRRYIRFKFKHDQNTTELRNASINKIRIFAFTKYSFPTDRFMGHTGHIYNFDYNMNTYFPNSILAKGGVTAYQSSDIRLKQDLRKLDYLGIIKAMGGTFGFAWKKDNTRSIGWIAQHVLCNPHLKDIVETDEKGYYKINYWSPKLIATAFGAIEQVGDEVSRLKARVVFLESEVQRLSGDKEDNNKKRLDNKNINSLN